MPSNDALLDRLLTFPTESTSKSTCSGENDAILGHEYDTSSPTPVLSIVLVDPPPQLGNIHSMVIQPKARIFKPQVLVVGLAEHEPRTIEEAFVSKEWTLAAQEEYDALIHNHTWTLVPLPTVLGCGFRETFNPVVKPATIHTILSIIVTKWWLLRQVYINNDFLDGDLTEEVYMQQPSSYVQTDANGKPLISKSNASLFIRIINQFHMYVLVYVDDIIIIGDSLVEIDTFVHRLHTEFSLKDMKSDHYFLDVEVTRSSTGDLYICQRKYILDLLEHCHMDKAKGVHTSMIRSCSLSKHMRTLPDDPREHQSIARVLQYVVPTRPSIAYTVNHTCQFMHIPTDVHFVAIKRILRYLGATIDYGLHIRPSERLSLIGYIDANWGLDFDDRRSTTEYCVYFGGNPVLCIVAVAANPILHLKFNHVEFDLFFVREKVADGSLIVGEVPICDQVADILTKPLSYS
ncbi:putative LRR receptor-like serine/threonine-protein kinase [Gossypium australe]|uniref:Putative LRR receptor-like serine/threonine-protein kinase n=1 Tax=Gossypium australe TaxID=47621 RepID=A0A5B6WQB2_9ROSI|nr:putative LRR receptor-like serine/threonine-protein kinase [Gossypium australe]